jgi:hypothetical protein
VPDETYLNKIITKYQSDEMAAKVQVNTIVPILKRWAGSHFKEAIYSGSIAKGTAISLCTDADVFISLSPTTPGNIGQIYTTLFNAFTQNGYLACKQNVSIGVSVEGCNIDFVPGKRQSQQNYDHILYKKKTNSRIKTNVKTHVSYVTESNRSREIKLTKIWSQLNKLQFPSFYLEMAVIDCLSGRSDSDLNGNFWKVISFMAGNFLNKNYADPANSNNIISNDLTKTEKLAIQSAAKLAQSQPNWEYVIW